MSSFLYKLKSGKNSKWRYYLRHFIQYLIPRSYYRIRREHLLKNIHKRQDYPQIRERVNYYNKLAPLTPLPENASSLAQFRLKKKTPGGSVYFFDSYTFTRWFPNRLKWCYRFGDVTTIPDVPSIVKSRPVAGNNANSVLLKLNQIRHFIFVKDTIPFASKKDKLIFRGKVGKKPKRERFMQLYFGHPMCDLGHIGKGENIPAEWHTQKMTIREHLNYKFILALEGIDVSSNLKWIMSSNSVAVMPEPEFETWFMEGRLIPDYHYIRIKADYSDLEERLQYYIDHPDKAQEIARHANEYVRQFKNRKREKLISLLVLQKYFQQTGQL